MNRPDAIDPPAPDEGDPMPDLFGVARIADDRYRAPPAGPAWARVFGGQLLAEAILAAGDTVAAPRSLHSIHAHFLRPGDPAAPIDYRVTRLRDGTSLSARRVAAAQHGRTLLALTASFHDAEPGLAHHDPMPADQPPPEALRGDRSLLAGRAATASAARRLQIRRRGLVEFRPVDPARWLDHRPRPPRQAYWIRAAIPLPDPSPLFQRALLAYASDHLLLSTGLVAHGIDWLTREIREASLDHALWFHADPKLDEWMLYTVESPWAGGARMLNRGQIHARDGRLLASVAQEGLIRL